MSKIEKDGLGNGSGKKLFSSGKVAGLTKTFSSIKSNVYEIRVGCSTGVNIRVYFSIEKNTNELSYLFAEKKKTNELTLSVTRTITQIMKNQGIW